MTLATKIFFTQTFAGLVTYPAYVNYWSFVSTASAIMVTEKTPLTSTRHSICLLLFSQIARGFVVVLGGPCRDVWLQTLYSYRKGLLAPRPTPKLEDHPTSSVRDCLFNIFAATLLIEGRSSIRNLRTRHAVVTGTDYMTNDHNLQKNTKRIQFIYFFAVNIFSA